MPSECAELMNAIFRDRPWDASPQAHVHGDGDGASARRPPRTPKGVTVGEVDQPSPNSGKYHGSIIKR